LTHGTHLPGHSQQLTVSAAAAEPAICKAVVEEDTAEETNKLISIFAPRAELI
jgi:hypothetical protein